jgi:hypothetical protein
VAPVLEAPDRATRAPRDRLTDAPRGGHVAAWEEPEVLAAAAAHPPGPRTREPTLSAAVATDVTVVLVHGTVADAVPEVARG